MATPNEIALARAVYDLQRQVAALSGARQLPSTTIEAADGSAVPIADAALAGVGAAAAVPELQAVAEYNSSAVDSLRVELDDSADLLDDVFDAAADDLEDARADLVDAQQDIDDAFVEMGDNVQVAIVAAGTAEQSAEYARDVADQAAQAATDASNLATSASSAAADAAQAALDAAGIAGAKGELIVQVSAPTGARANPANLWYDISTDANGNPRNTPNRYNTTTGKWEPITDQKVIDAAAAAAAAKTTADQAKTNAATAQTTADQAKTAASNAQGTADQAQQLATQAKTNAATAQTTADNANAAALNAAGIANGKGKLIVQVSAPTGANAVPENLWFDISTDSAGKPRNTPNRWNPSTSKWEPITDQKVIDAATAAATAQQTADTAKTNAATAQAAADKAKSDAAAAQQAADQAKSAASTAQTAADNANTQALTATGLANGKGKVIYQATAPTGANASTTNLWIRTTDNTPWTYNGSTWTQVTDKTATDAAAAAAAAKTAADNAAAAAAAAQATANGRPLILFSTSGPSGNAPTGSTWFQINTSESIIGQWQQTGSATSPVWTPRPITSEVIANLDVGKLTAGNAAIATLVAQKIAASTASFQTVNVANLFVTQGATMQQAVIDYLFANVVQARKITADMIDVNTLNGITLNGVNVVGGRFSTAKSTSTSPWVQLNGAQLVFRDGSDNLRGQMQALPDGLALYGYAPDGSGSASSIRLARTLYSRPGLTGGSFTADVAVQDTYVNGDLFVTNLIRDGRSNTALTGSATNGGRRVYAKSFAVPATEAQDVTGDPSLTREFINGQGGTVVGMFDTIDVYNNARIMGQLDLLRARLSATGDASLGSTGHAFQIGDDGGTNLILDQNELMVRLNGAASGLYLNADGGTVGLGNNDSTINLPGIFNAAYLPSRIRVGSATHNNSIAAGSFGSDVRITFPSGYFTQAPIVFAVCSNSRVTAAATSPSSTGFTIGLGNWSNGTAGGPLTVYYIAVQFSG